MTSQTSPFSKEGASEGRRLNTAITLSGLGCWELNLSDDQFWMSEKCKATIGYRGGDVVPYEEILELIYPGDRQKTRESFQRALNPQSDGSLDIEIRILSDEEPFHHWLNWKGQVSFSADGKPDHFSGLVYDISCEVKQRHALNNVGTEDNCQISLAENARLVDLQYVNQELAKVNAEFTATNEELAHINELLVKSNEDLQQFAYVASHDLQEPLRKISSFGELLRARFGSNLGDGIEYLDRMQVAAKRMSKMIDDLLIFSRVNTADPKPSPISLSAIVSDVINDLEVPVNQSQAIIIVDQMPVIKGDGRQLTQLFQNLIGNALKFTRPGVPPQIHINWAIVKGSTLPADVYPGLRSRAYDRIDVSDNGIGFDPKNQERIFKVFQRLHGRSEFEGTGIGLAICEKVMANHGGAIKAESEIGQGSKFSVYFPIG